MAYAFLLLAALAVITWSMWSGISLPDIHIDEVPSAGIQQRVHSFLQDTNERIRASIRGAIRNQLHEAVDEALPEE